MFFYVQTHLQEVVPVVLEVVVVGIVVVGVVVVAGVVPIPKNAPGSEQICDALCEPTLDLSTINLQKLFHI
jgi:hypothetical protein